MHLSELVEQCQVRHQGLRRAKHKARVHLAAAEQRVVCEYLESEKRDVVGLGEGRVVRLSCDATVACSARREESVGHQLRAWQHAIDVT